MAPRPFRSGLSKSPPQAGFSCLRQKLGRLSGRPKRHGDEGFVAIAFDEQQHRLAAGLTGIGDRGLDVAGVVDRSVVHRDDDIAGLNSGGGGRLVRVDPGDHRTVDRARQVELLAHVGCQVGKADAEARLAAALALAGGTFGRGLFLAFLIGADGNVEIDRLAVAPDAERFLGARRKVGDQARQVFRRLDGLAAD